MKCSILHESSGRMRVHLHCGRMTLRQADVLEYYLKNEPGVLDVTVFDRTQDAVIRYRQDRSGVIGALARFSFAGAEKLDLVPDHTARAINREFEEKLIFTLCRRACNRLFLPLPVAAAIAAGHPWCVDISSGAETDGYKDPEKIRRLTEIVRIQG